MSPYLKPEPRTVWDAARDLFVRANARRDERLWQQGYRLWVYACIKNAPGKPWMWLDLKPVWLP